MPAKNNMNIAKPSLTIVEKEASAVNSALFGFTQFAGYELFVAMADDSLCAVSFCTKSQLEHAKQRFSRNFPNAQLLHDDTIANSVSTVLDDWYSHEKPPRLSILLAGTSFQICVWKALLSIPPGLTSSYKRLADSIGRPGSARAVGNAAGANPIAIFVPCHRLLASNGAIGGYAWGPDCKRRLLELEGLSIMPSGA